MIKKKTTKTLSQLDFERRWLSAQLQYGSTCLAAHEIQKALTKVDTLNLKIAARPAETVEELLIKLDLVSELLGFSTDGSVQDTFEAVMFCAVLNDARRLADHEINPNSA